MDRRVFLRGLVAAGAAAIAAEFGVSEEVGAELEREFRKDLGRTVYGMPKTEFLGQNVVDGAKFWTSTADIRKFYADETAKALGRAVDYQIETAVRRMQSCIDADFAKMKAAGVPEGKVILRPPKIVKLDTRGCKFELIAGSKPGTSFLGTATIEVGFIPGAPEIDGVTGKPRSTKILGANGREL